jgi:hypothetical protein
MNSTIHADLVELKARFETWRTNRKYVREPIPDELWSAAADLTRRYPPSLVGRVLVSLRQNGVGTGLNSADAILPKGHGCSGTRGRLTVDG